MSVNQTTYTPEEVANKLNISSWFAWKLAREGFCGAFKIGRLWRFPGKRVDELVTAGEKRK